MTHVHVAVVIGLGEIGVPILKLLTDAYGDQVRGRDVEEPEWRFGGIPLREPKFRFMHICFPETMNFLNEVAIYMSRYDPDAVIIHSTLSPGMTERISEYLWDFELLPGIFFSPVRGNVTDGMIWGLKTYTKFLSPCSRTGPDMVSMVKEHLQGAEMRVEVVSDATTLEYAKLLDLAYYGTCIAVFQEIERIVNERNLQYGTIKQFIGSTGEESQGKVPRTLYYGGYIGGHCVVPGIEKILGEHDVPLLKAVLESNVKRFKELLFRDSIGQAE